MVYECFVMDLLKAGIGRMLYVSSYLLEVIGQDLKLGKYPTLASDCVH